ncbi:MAG: DMT family transporter [Bacteroidales bacterium]|nr:DMT family transporter [Bacteroidales bacterium]
MKNQTKAYLLAVLAVLFWSTVATAFKIALQQLDFIQLLAVAAYTTFIIAGIFLLISGKVSLIKGLTAKDFAWFALLGLLNPLGYYLVLFKAYDLLPAQIAQPLNYTWPVVLVFLSAPLLKQKLKWKNVAALIVSFSGVAIISMQGGIVNLKGSNLLGVLLAVGSSMIWAVYFLLNTQNRHDTVIKVFFNFLFGSIYISLILWWQGEFILLDISAVLPGIYVGFFEMGFTFILWMMALRLTDRTDKISPLVYFSPFISLIFIHYILGEQIYNTTFVGLVLIVGGVLLTYFPKRKMT